MENFIFWTVVLSVLGQFSPFIPLKIWENGNFLILSEGVKRDVMHCAIWYHLYNFKNVKNTHGAVLILVKLQAKGCNFTKINNP